MNLVEQAKGLLSQAVADLQAEVGQFLTLKARILRLQPDALKNTLLAKQENLEGRLTAAIAQASAMRDAIPTSIMGLSINKLGEYASMVSKAQGLARDVLGLRQEMKAQTAAVEQGAYSATPGATGEQTGIQKVWAFMQSPYGLLLGVGLAAGGWWLYKRTEDR
jgi:hypothetical protein